MIKIGYMVPFLTVKAMPDYEAILVELIGKGVYAQLPKMYALRDYKIGESGWAAIFDIKGARVTLSQTSTQYIRKVMEFLCAPLIQQGLISVKRVARLESSGYCKVAVKSLCGLEGRELAEQVSPYLKDSGLFIKEKVIIVTYSDNDEEFIKNAFYPAPKEQIISIAVNRLDREVDIMVSNESIRGFIGKKGANVMTVNKLTKYKVNIFDEHGKEN